MKTFIITTYKISWAIFSLSSYDRRSSVLFFETQCSVEKLSTSTLSLRDTLTRLSDKRQEVSTIALSNVVNDASYIPAVFLDPEC